MSLAILKQTYDEVRRLSIAGSVVAANDFRLKKLAGPLEQAGQKAPVFAKVAQAVTRLVEAREQESAEALLELSTLVNAILYTQGETSVPGELEPIQTTDLGQQHTRASARVLKPLIESLTTTGSGRLEAIKSAHERGAFRDLRLVGPALAALDDSYAEIGGFMAAEVLPMYGQAIVPELRATLDLKGRGGHVHRLTLMHRLAPDLARETIKRALDDGSKEMRVAAIECLGDSPEDLAYLLEQSKAKAKDVRAAALRALARCDAAEAAEALRSAFGSGSIDVAAEAVAATSNSRLQAFVVEEVQSQWEGLLGGKEKDKSKLGKIVSRLLVGLRCLAGRKDLAAQKLLVDAFAQRDKLAAIKSEPGGKDVEEHLATIMATGPAGAQAALIEAHATLSPDQLADAFRAACRVRTPAQVFDMFSPYLAGRLHLRKKSRDAASVKREAIASVLIDDPIGRQFGVAAHGADDGQLVQRLDPRWLDLAVNIEALELVQALARPGHAGANKMLATEFATQLKKSTHLFDLTEVLGAMVRAEHAGATDAVVATLQKHAKSAGSYGAYGMLGIAPLVAELPKDAAPKIEALLTGLPEKVVDLLVESVAQLKNRP